MQIAENCNWTTGLKVK